MLYFTRVQINQLALCGAARGEEERVELGWGGPEARRAGEVRIGPQWGEREREVGGAHSMCDEMQLVYNN